MASFQKNIIPVRMFIWMILSCVLGIEGSPQCNIEEYWLKLFGRCMPCNQICNPLDRSNCARNCPDYIKQLSCPTDRYWSKVYDTCLQCSIICSPQNRTICQSNCRRYIDTLKFENTTTEIIPIPTTNIPLTISNWAEEHIVYIVISSFVLLIIGACIALYLCRPKVEQYLKCGRNCKRNTNTVQETNEAISMPMMAIGRNTQPRFLNTLL